MLIESNFQSDSNDREILPAEFSSQPYICMLTDLIKYNGIFPWHWHSALEIDYIVEGDIEFQTPEYTMLLKKGDAVFINSEILHTYHARSRSACKLHAILFDAHFISGMYHSLLEEKYISPILKNQQLEAFHIHPGTPHSAALIESIQRVVALSVSEPFGYEFAVRSALSSFWCGLLEDTEVMRFFLFRLFWQGISPCHGKDTVRIPQGKQIKHLCIETCSCCAITRYSSSTSSPER